MRERGNGVRFDDYFQWPMRFVGLLQVHETTRDFLKFKYSSLMEYLSFALALADSKLFVWFIVRLTLHLSQFLLVFVQVHVRRIAGVLKVVI